jgi:chromate reductase, NAD(P)H dehydrogenase (quinone)
MITIISGSNRPGSNTQKIAKAYLNNLTQKNIDAQLLSLEEHEVFTRNENFVKVEAQYLLDVDKFIFVIPEYNGSYPGIVKLMIDNSDVGKCWANKKALITGVASGRAGNLRGMEHFTGSLMHMKMHVHPNRLPISAVHTLMNAEGKLSDEATLKLIDTQIDEFLNAKA